MLGLLQASRKRLTNHTSKRIIHEAIYQLQKLLVESGSCRSNLKEEAWESRLATRLRKLHISVQTQAEVELHYKDLNYKPLDEYADMVLGKKVGSNMQYASFCCFHHVIFDIALTASGSALSLCGFASNVLHEHCSCLMISHWVLLLHNAWMQMVVPAWYRFAFLQDNEPRAGLVLKCSDSAASPKDLTHL